MFPCRMILAGSTRLIRTVLLTAPFLGLGQDGNNVTNSTLPTSGTRMTIKTTHDLRLVLVAGTTTNELIERLGAPTAAWLLVKGTDHWSYGLTPFPAGEEFREMYVVGVEMDITNGRLANWGCTYSPNPWPGNGDGPEISIPNEGGMVSNSQESLSLKFFVLSPSQIEGGRFIDTDQMPKLGYISKNPGLEIRKLVGATWQERRPAPLSENPNQKTWAVKLFFTKTDGTRFAAFTETNIGKQILMTLGDRPLFSASIAEPISGGNVEVKLTNQSIFESVRRQLVDMPREIPPSK